MRICRAEPGGVITVRRQEKYSNCWNLTGQWTVVALLKVDTSAVITLMPLTWFTTPLLWSYSLEIIKIKSATM